LNLRLPGLEACSPAGHFVCGSEYAYDCNPNHRSSLGQRMTPKPLQYLFNSMHHGKHSFDDFLAFDVPGNVEKITWPSRTIYRPSKKLKVFQSFLNSVLFDHLPVNVSVSFAYRKGSSLRQAIEVHAKSRVFYQTDFSKFFQSIDSDLIRKSVLSSQTPIEDITEHLDHIVSLTTVQKRLAIGFVTSPAISNICLKSFDDCLEAWCRSCALIYSRYADDIIISTLRDEDLNHLDIVVSRFASEQINPHITLNSTKRKLTKIGRRVQIMGFDILPTGRVTIGRKIRHKVEYLIHFLVSNRTLFEKIYEGDLEKGLLQLGGFVSHIHSADPLYLSKLRRKFGTTIVDALLHRSLNDESD
jgi:RNA-directed DNA polymerase